MTTSLFMRRGISTGFVNYASQNPIKNVETLGVLIGKVDDKRKELHARKLQLQFLEHHPFRKI